MIPLRLGDVAVSLLLDKALEPLWRGPSHELAEPPSLLIELRSAELRHENFSPFAPESLFARNCRLRRRVEDGVETVEGECLPSEGALNHALRFASQPALLRHGWLLVHGCSIATKSGVQVFAAPSGTGKTTLARRAARAGLQVLGDEIALLRGAVAASHPAQLLADGSACGTLRTLHFLERGDPSTRPLSKAQALARLLSLTMLYEEGRESESLVLEAAAAIVEQVKAQVTTLPDDDRALGIFDEVAR